MKLATILATIPLVLGLPTSNGNGNANIKRSQGAFTVMSSRSASPIHLLPMNAANGSFWLGEKASTYCPSTVSNVAPCPKGDATQIVVGGEQSSLVSPPRS